jgi:hypothetical protein
MIFFPEPKTLYVCHGIEEDDGPTLTYSLIVGWAPSSLSSLLHCASDLYPWIAREGGTGADDSRSALECITEVIAVTDRIPVVVPRF